MLLKYTNKYRQEIYQVGTCQWSWTFYKTDSIFSALYGRLFCWVSHGLITFIFWCKRGGH